MANPSLSIGDPAPWFQTTAGHDSSSVAWDELAGRFILLLFFGSAARPEVAKALSCLNADLGMFDGERSLLLGVSADSDDFSQARLPERAGRLYLLDAGGGGAARYGIAATPAHAFRPTAFLLSPALQILDILPLEEPEAFARKAAAALHEVLAEPPMWQNAPVLIVPRVFDRTFCRRLIALYEESGGREIGLIENEGQAVARVDRAYRKRGDYYVAEDGALATCRELLERRLLPFVYRAFQFPTTRIERYLVGCYDATAGGYFRPHRDNTALPVAHRRFAVTLPLNNDYEGGRLRFPEFGGREFNAAPGEAIIFSCSLLHEVTPVTAGRRYAFITFLYDEQGQRMREQYAKNIGRSQPA